MSNFESGQNNEARSNKGGADNYKPNGATPPNDNPPKSGFAWRDGYSWGELEWGKEIDRFDYQNVDGSPWARVKRMEPKRFPVFTYKQFTLNPDTGHPNNWIFGIPEGPRLPYHANLLAQAPKDQWIWIPEGEGDADAIFDVGLLSTTAIGGTQGWFPDDLNRHFAERICIICGDDDPPGIRFARFKLRSLLKVAKRVIYLSDWDGHKDVRDFLRAKYPNYTNTDSEDCANAKAELEKRARFAFALDDLARLPLSELDSAKKEFCKEHKLEKSTLNTMLKRRREDHKPVNDDESDGPTNFVMGEKELRYLNSEGVGIRVCDSFEVLGECRDPNEGEWGLMLRFRNRDGRERKHIVVLSALYSDAHVVCAELASLGLAIEFDQQAKLSKYLCGVKVENRLRVVKRPGWMELDGERAFVLPEKIIRRKTVDSEEIIADFKSSHKQRRTLDDWKNGVATLVAGHYVPMLAVGGAFVGPLLSITGEEGGGFHLQELSGKGKTTSLAAAASVWGRGAKSKHPEKNDGYMLGWESTGNGLEARLVNSNDTCIVLDEINTGDARVISGAAYTISNGMGKQRMNRNLTMRRVETWTTFLISSGEVTMEQKITEHKDKVMAGQLARILDIPADRGKGFGVFDNGGPQNNPRLLAEAIGKAARTSYGTAGPEFVRKLMERGADSVALEFDTYKEAFLDKHSTKEMSQQVARVAKKFALIAFAGKLATDFGILPWSADAPEEAVLWAFDAWMEKRGGGKETEEIMAVRQVQFLMEQHSESRFEERGNNDGFPVRDRLGFRVKKEGQGLEYWVLPETWRDVFCKGFDPARVAEWLEKRGMLKKGDAGYQTKKDLGGGRNNRERVYVLTNKVIEDAPPPRDRDSESL